MQTAWRRWWPLGKALLALLILAGVGWQFARILSGPELWEQPFTLRPGWAAASAVLYLLGLALWGAFWLVLLRKAGELPGAGRAYRAYYVGHLGKYIPGKAWVLFLRAAMLAGTGVRVGVAAVTAGYETLTTMTAGALVAVLLLPLVAAEQLDLGWKALGLLALAGIPILPGVFNRLVGRLAARFPGAGTALPPVRITTLAFGLAVTAGGWLLLGTSTWAMLQALAPKPTPWTWQPWLRCTAFTALAYVAGFLTLPAPGGLGVRELILQQLLAPELARQMAPEPAAALAVVAVLLLRLLWTAAELVTAGVVYFLPGFWRFVAMSCDRETASREPTGEARK